MWWIVFVVSLYYEVLNEYHEKEFIIRRVTSLILDFSSRKVWNPVS